MTPTASAASIAYEVLALSPASISSSANPPTVNVGGRGGRSTYQYTMQGPDLDQLKLYSDKLVDYLKDLPAFVGVNTDMDAAMPSVHVSIDRDRAAASGRAAQPPSKPRWAMLSAASRSPRSTAPPTSMK